MSGQVDYLLRVVVPDIEAYDRVYKQLIEVADLYDVTSSFSMEQIKYTTALPLSFVRTEQEESEVNARGGRSRTTRATAARPRA